MSYSVKHKAAGRYGLVDQGGNWLADFLGSKDEAEAKAHELNQGDAQDNLAGSTENTCPDKSSVSSNDQAGSSDKGDSSRAPAPFVSTDQDADPVTTAKSTQSQTAQTDTGNTSPKHFILTDTGWLLRG